MSQNWAIPQNAEEYFSQQSKRQGQEERRPLIRKASDLLGPGIAPFAVTIDDLDGDIAAFNGFFIVPPGTPNSPDDTTWWIGQTIAGETGGGTQMFSTFQSADAPHVVMLRGFVIAPDSPARFYSPWQQISAPPAPVDTGWVPITYQSGYSGTGEVRKVGTHVTMVGYIARASGFSTSLQAAGILPPGFFPSREHYFGIGHPNTTVINRAAVTTGGSIQIAMSAATSGGQGLATDWYTD